MQPSRLSDREASDHILEPVPLTTLSHHILQAWKRTHKTTEQRSELLRQIPPEELGRIFKVQAGSAKGSMCSQPHPARGLADTRLKFQDVGRLRLVYRRLRSTFAYSEISSQCSAACSQQARHFLCLRFALPNFPLS